MGMAPVAPVAPKKLKTKKITNNTKDIMQFKIGNALEASPKEGQTLYFLNLCTTYGGWNKGYQTKLGYKFPRAKKKYRDTYRRLIERKGSIVMGHTQTVEVGPNMYVLNIVCQNLRRSTSHKTTISIATLRTRLREFCYRNTKSNVVIVIPRIGCGIQGVRWSDMQTALKAAVQSQGKNKVSITVYDLKKRKEK